MNQTTTAIAYAKWLNTMQWDYYCTFTTKYSMSMKSARKAMERFHDRIKKSNPEAKLFFVAEPFDVKNSYHTHALVSFNNAITKNVKPLLAKAWQAVSKGAGGKSYNHTEIQPYKKDLGANFYVSKYMLRNNSDYDILY